jgi:hypothetical protein
MKSKEILEELNLVFKGKTIDVLIPPTLFIILVNFTTILQASVIALSTSVIIIVLRFIQKKAMTYALYGSLATIFALIFSLISNSTSDFYLPGLINSSLVVILMLALSILNRPIAAYASHLTRSWPLEWFWRSDIKPAYVEVSWMWVLLFSLRLGILWYGYFSLDFTVLVVMNTVLGLPFMIIVLIATYIYGTYRLKQLQGPGVDEYMQAKSPPYRGQSRGF